MRTLSPTINSLLARENPSDCRLCGLCWTFLPKGPLGVFGRDLAAADGGRCTGLFAETERIVCLAGSFALMASANALFAASGSMGTGGWVAAEEEYERSLPGVGIPDERGLDADMVSWRVATGWGARSRVALARSSLKSQVFTLQSLPITCDRSCFSWLSLRSRCPYGICAGSTILENEKRACQAFSCVSCPEQPTYSMCMITQCSWSGSAHNLNKSG